MTRRTACIIASLFFIGILSAQKNKIGFSLEEQFNVNFWEKLDGYKRRNNMNNFTTAAGIDCYIKNFRVSYKILKGIQSYTDFNSNDIIAPWHIKGIYYNSKYNGQALTLNYLHPINLKFHYGFGCGIQNLTFKKIRNVVKMQDGRAFKSNIPINDLDNRIDLLSNFLVGYRINSFLIEFSVSQLSVVHSLNSVVPYPNAILFNNSKSAVVFSISMRYNIWKSKNL